MKTLIAIREMPFAESTIRLGGLFADLNDSQVTLLTVLQAREERSEGEARLAAAAKLLGRSDVRLKVRQGDPVEEILAEAAEEEYDLVAVGWRDIPVLPSLFFGGVPRRVVDRAPGSVLVVKEGAPAHLGRILLATGGQRLNRSVIRQGAALTRLAGAELTVLHVGPPVPSMYAGLDRLEETLDELLETDTPLARHLRWGRAYLQEQGIEADWLLRHGVATEEILHEAVLGEYDLIVIGARTPAGPLKQLLMDKVTPQVVERATIPVLVVRDRESQV